MTAVLVGGESDQLRALHDRHGPALWSYAVGLTGGDHGKAQDVVQESSFAPCATSPGSTTPAVPRGPGCSPSPNASSSTSGGRPAAAPKYPPTGFPNSQSRTPRSKPSTGTSCTTRCGPCPPSTAKCCSNAISATPRSPRPPRP